MKTPSRGDISLEVRTCARRSVGAVRRRGFSLVEILVAMAVLALLGVLLVQMTSAAGHTTRLSNRLVGAASEARLAFDRIGSDLGAQVKRGDTDFVAGNPSPPGDSLLFLSGVISQGGDRNLSLVAYRMATHPDNMDADGTSRICLLRAGMPIPWVRSAWGTAGFMGLRNDGLPVQFSSSDGAFASVLLPTATDFDVLAPGVLRMVVGFQLYPDNNPVTFQDGTSVANALGQIVYSAPVRMDSSTPPVPLPHIDQSRISAILVGVVAVDADSLKLLSAVDAATLSAAFPTPAAGETPVQAWAPLINDLVSSGSGPLPVRQALRVYQRVYPIAPYGSTLYE